jgi:tetratricopeptide (TPR) repeat protein
MMCRRLVIALLVAGVVNVASANPEPRELAERYNEEGKSLFARGELEAAARKFRAAIAIDPEARYFFNLCFVLNARYQLEAALGACEQVASARGADDRLIERAADLIAVIEKKRAGARPPKNSGELEGSEPKPEPEPPVDDGAAGGGDGQGGAGGVELPASKPVAYPVPIGEPRQPQRVAVQVRPEPPPRAFHIGLITGLAFANHEELGAGLESDTRTGFETGAFVATSFSRIVAGQAEILYAQKGGEVAFDYLSMPIVAKVILALGKRAKLHLDAGVSMSFLLRAQSDVALPEDIGSRSKRFDLGAIAGLGMTLHRQGSSAFIFDVRFERGLLDVEDIPEVQVKNRVTSVRFGYGF